MIISRTARKSVIIALAAIMLFMGVQPKKADAFIPALFLNPWVIGATVALIGAGVSIASSDGAKAIASDFLSSLTDFKLRDSFAAITGGALLVTAGMNSALKNYIDGKLKTYDSTTQLHYLEPTQTENGNSFGKVGAPLADPWLIPIQQGKITMTPYLNSNTQQLRAKISYTINPQGSIYSYSWKVYASGYPYDYRYEVLDYNANRVYQSWGNSTLDKTIAMQTNDDGSASFFLDNVEVYHTPILNFTMNDGTVRKPFLESLTGWNTSSVPYFDSVSTSESVIVNVDKTYNFDATIDDRYMNENAGLANRSITIPKTASGDVVATPEDLIATGVKPGDLVISEPMAGAGEATQTGILSNIAAMVGSITATISEPVGNFQNVTWDKLKLAGETMTTQFPFSLPWDVYHAFTATFGGFAQTDAPHWVWNFKGQTMDIRMPQILIDMAPYFRGALLIMFDVGLIYSVRKLLGGAS